MTRWIRGRARLLSLFDRSPLVRRVAARVAAAVAARRGADPDVLESAVSGAGDRPAIVSAQMIQWAGALGGVSRTPIHFRPADQLDAEVANRVLERHDLFGTSDPHLLRQLWSMTPEGDFDEMIEDARARLPALLVSARPQPPVSTSPARQIRAIELLTGALAGCGTQPFLMSGTLLGVVRDGAPMATDYDVDLGLLPGSPPVADVVSALSEALPTARCAVESADRLVVTIEDVKVDLFFHFEREGRVWHRTDIHEWWNTPFGLEARTVGDVRTWIPEQPERYLVENYGSGWTSSVPFYDMSFDTPNREYRRTPAALAYLTRRLFTSLECGDRWVYERCADALQEYFDIDIDIGPESDHRR